jgi:hypothetical protein
MILSRPKKKSRLGHNPRHFIPLPAGLPGELESSYWNFHPADFNVMLAKGINFMNGDNIKYAY